MEGSPANHSKGDDQQTEHLYLTINTNIHVHCTVHYRSPVQLVRSKTKNAD